MSDLHELTTAGSAPRPWSWPWPAADLAVWAAIGAGVWPATSPHLDITRWADADPRVILEALGAAGLADQPAEVLLAAAWAGLARWATDRRDEAITAAVTGGGLSLRQVARWTGLTHPGVARIVARRT